MKNTGIVMVALLAALISGLAGIFIGSRSPTVTAGAQSVATTAPATPSQPPAPTMMPSPSPATPAPAKTDASSWADVVEQFSASVVMVRSHFPETFMTYEGRGSGSGVVIAVDKSAYIITNAHVVQGAAIVTVALTDDRQPRPARVIGLSACDDLAILKVDVIDGLRPATFSTTPPRIGEQVMAFGYPLDHLLGGSMSVTQGVISKLHMSFPDLPYVELIQTDTAINPGNSGGPLVNRNGHVVGITSLGLWPGFADGINFAIPVYSSAELIATLQGGKRYQWLGMNTFDSDRYGVVVDAVESGSPAARAGIEPGDIIIKLEGLSIESSLQICRILRSHSDGDALQIEVKRTNDWGTYRLRGELVIGAPDKVVAVTPVGPIPTPEPTATLTPQPTMTPTPEPTATPAAP